ncbi:MAG: hypothetical protein IKY64_07455 [Bacteroidaceae bacterium]|nr:hypothetical protein [Bacteroidaceae bacterium]
MKCRVLLYLFLVTTLCMGCGNAPSMRQLQELEARVNDAPDSVLAVLTAADMPRWGEARALYALLTVEAQDKSYIDVADDSLISVATRYYDRRGPALHRLQAFYYHGRVFTKAGLRHEAMTAYTRAKDFVDEKSAPYPVGLLFLQMGVLCGYDYDYPQAIAHMEEATSYFEMADNARLQNISKRNVGQFYLNMEDTKRADSLFNEVLTWAEENEDDDIRYSILDLKLFLYDATGNSEALERLYNNYSIETILPSSTNYGIMSHYHARKGDELLADELLAKAWAVSTTAEDSAILRHKSYQIYKILGRHSAALKNHEYLLSYQDSIVRMTLQQPLIVTQRDYYHSRLQVEELRNLNYRYLMGMAALALMVVAAILYIYVRNRFRRKQEELNEYIELSEGLLQRISEHDSAAVQMQSQIAELFGGQFQLLNKLSETYYEHSASKAMKEQIFAKVKDEIERLQSGKELPKIEAIVNKHLDNVMARLRSELPHLKDKDYAFLTYLYARFSGKAIGAFMKLERNHIYQIKHRLCSEIKGSDAPSKQFFLDMMP